MELYLANDELDWKIKELRQKIRLSMNGIVSELMTKNGIIYKKNYGVSIPRIIEIAKPYIPDHVLAQRLWAMEIRETMMMAALIEPIDNFPPDLAKNWIGKIKQLDLLEFTSLYLFSKLPYANALSIDCVFSDVLWDQITGFMIASRISNILNEKEIQKLTDKAFELSETNDYQLYKSIATCLSRFCRKDKITALKISALIEKNANPHNTGHQYISETVKYEIKFLNLL
ncbi:MAG: hypothetical protein Q7U47_03795 [Paludibacter sp.]|nr:hypothetical protein [Paludibacter sp.]